MYSPGRNSDDLLTDFYLYVLFILYKLWKNYSTEKVPYKKEILKKSHILDVISNPEHFPPTMKGVIVS